MKLTKYAAAAVLAAGMTLSAHALTITLGGLPDERRASLADAVSGVAIEGTGTAGPSDVDNAFGSRAPWTERSSIESGDTTEGLFTVNLNSGSSWGNGSASGTWAIASSFWSLYADAAISLHVGNGGGDPDSFIWLVTPGQTSGTWSYEKLSGGGGGLSNLKLYSSGTGGTRVPDGGSTLALVGLAVAGLGLARRKLS